MYVALIAIALFDDGRSGARGAGCAVRSTIGAAAATLTVAAGINPYITNTIVHGHPLYPAAGRDAFHLDVYRDSGFVNDSRPAQLFRSIFSRSNDDDQIAPRLKIPFSVARQRTRRVQHRRHTRTGGWGHAVLRSASPRSQRFSSRRCAASTLTSRALTLLTALFLLSALSIPFGYYSRYAPQVWLACLPALLVSDLRSRWTKLLAFILALNLAIIGAVSLGSQLFIEHRVHRGDPNELFRDASGNDVTYAHVLTKPRRS